MDPFSVDSNSSQEEDILPVSVQRSAGGGETVAEDQTNSALLLLQPFNKSEGQFSGGGGRQDTESSSEEVEMVVNHIAHTASEESTHSGSHVIAENHSPQSQLVPNTSYKGDGSMQVPTQPTQQSQCEDGGVETNSQRITRLEEGHKATEQKVDRCVDQLERLKRDNELRAVTEDARAQSQNDLIREMRLQLSTSQGTCHAPNSLSPIEESFGSLRGEHPYGQVQNSTIVFSPNTSFSAPSWSSQ